MYLRTIYPDMLADGDVKLPLTVSADTPKVSPVGC
jgi:hypothetical protein